MTRGRFSLLVAGVLVALAALIGISLWARPDTSTNASRPDHVRPIEKGDEYVAIGDSYTAAPGTGPPTDVCEQTTTNYPHQVAARLGLKLKDVSCGAATTDHVTAPQVNRFVRRPPQADALSHGTDLVTISLGGNDGNAIGHIAFACTAIRFKAPEGAPCQEADAVAKGGTLETQIEDTEQRLVGVIRQVAQQSPTARIVVVGYPEFFPEAGSCAQLPLARGDYAFAHRINELLVRAQKHAAARADVEYVDVFTPSRGHHMCAQDPWIAGLRPTRTDATPLHPYPEEQQLVADLLVDRLT